MGPFDPRRCKGGHVSATAGSWRRSLQYIAAFLVTATVAPLTFLFAVLYSTIAGRWFNVWWLGNAAALLVVGLAARRLAGSPGGQCVGWACAAGAWAAGLGYWGAGYLGGDVAPAVVAVAFLAASLWNPWLGWMFLAPQSWKFRGGVLAVLSLAPIAFAALLAPGDLSGDEQFSFRWRFSSAARRDRGVVTLRPESALPESDLGGDDFPQFLGPDRNARLSSPKLNPDWTSHPPEILWRIPLGPAWSSFALVGNRALTLEQVGDEEAASAYDLASGKLLWRDRSSGRFDGAGLGEGPRSTPTVHRGRVFALGAMGRLRCLDLATGSVLWSRDVLADVGASLQMHGASASPLAVDDLVVVCPSGQSAPTLAAYRVSDGAPRWTAGRKGPAYSSPMLADLLGQTVLLHVDGAGLSVLRPEDGAELAQFSWNEGQDNVAQPIVDPRRPDRVLLTSANSAGSTLLQFARDAEGRWSVRPAWSRPILKTKLSTAVRADRLVYGLDNGILACLDVDAGRLLWKKGRYRHGQLLLVDELLLVLSEDGELVLIDPQPSGLIELGRFQALEGKTWNTPALKGAFLAVRNDRQGACVRLATFPGSADQLKRSATTSP